MCVFVCCGASSYYYVVCCVVSGVAFCYYVVLGVVLFWCGFCLLYCRAVVVRCFDFRLFVPVCSDAFDFVVFCCLGLYAQSPVHLYRHKHLHRHQRLRLRLLSSSTCTSTCTTASWFTSRRARFTVPLGGKHGKSCCYHFVCGGAFWGVGAVITLFVVWVLFVRLFVVLLLVLACLFYNVVCCNVF